MGRCSAWPSGAICSRWFRGLLVLCGCSDEGSRRGNAAAFPLRAVQIGDREGGARELGIILLSGGGSHEQSRFFGPTLADRCDRF